MEPESPSLEEDVGLNLVVPIGFTMEQLTTEENRLIKIVTRLHESAETIREQLRDTPEQGEMNKKLIRAATVNDKELQRKKRELHDLRQMIRHMEQKSNRQMRVQQVKHSRFKSRRKVFHPSERQLDQMSIYSSYEEDIPSDPSRALIKKIPKLRLAKLKPFQDSFTIRYLPSQEHVLPSS